MRVLVVDDQSHVRRWVRSVLKTMGITDVAEAADGREAMTAVVQPGAWFDLILCDLRMPTRDGIETIRAFAGLGIESAIIIMSVEEERMIESAGALAEMQGLRLLGTVHKPLTPANLEPLLQRVPRVDAVRRAEPPVVAREDLANAFSRGELLLHYQPKVWMASGKFAGVEALVRWKHPELGLVPPGAFVPLMEESDVLSASLGDFAVREALACSRRWHDAGRELNVAINLSARTFDDLEFPERLDALCVAAQVPARDVTLEVTETQVARDAIRMIDVATRLRLKGFSLAVDDFGTGQSGLAQLQRMPFNEIKIDRQFVHGCSTSATQRSVVEASIALAHSLKMTSVAEGIQDRPDWDVVAGLGCDIVQGFAIARPMSETRLRAWAAQWSLING